MTCEQGKIETEPSADTKNGQTLENNASNDLKPSRGIINGMYNMSVTSRIHT